MTNSLEKKMKRNRVAMTLSLSPEIAEDYEKIARQEAKNKNQLFRDMFRLYQERLLEKEFFELQKYGAKQARGKQVFTEAKVERIVLEGR
jgi:hypothetical protein